MKRITNIIQSLFNRGRKHVILLNSALGGWSATISKHRFGDVVFFNCVELLTDLLRDVTWQFDGTKPTVESAFVRFYNEYSKIAMYRYFANGVIVIAHEVVGEGPMAAHEFRLASENKDYTKYNDGDYITYRSMRENTEIYAIHSTIYQAVGKSHREMCEPFVSYLDNTLNASNTVSERMGAFVVCSPKNITNAPTAIELDADEKEELQKDIRDQYGALSKQSQVMVLPREMTWQTVSLASIDMRTDSKVRIAVTAIADCIKIPANQVSMIDANNSKTLANGSEMREGDYNKYQSFERYLDAIFVQMARDAGLRPGAIDITQGTSVGSYYTIYNKPERQKTI